MTPKGIVYVCLECFADDHCSVICVKTTKAAAEAWKAKPTDDPRFYRDVEVAPLEAD